MTRRMLAESPKRWWLAPARFPTAPATLLRKVVPQTFWSSEPWLHQVRVGIRDQFNASIGAPAALSAARYE